MGLFFANFWNLYQLYYLSLRDFPGGSVVKNPPASTGDTGWIPVLHRSPGGENSSSLQYSYLGNPTNREAWGAVVYGIAKELDRTLGLTNTNET